MPGQIFREDVEAAAQRIPYLEEVNTVWFEEPFLGGAYGAYAGLAAKSGKVKLAGGEAAHNFHMAQQLVDYGKVGFLQIDCGRIGGIGPAKRAADYAAARGVTYVNHTFTSHLALCASLQPYAGLEAHRDLRISLRAQIRGVGHERDAPDARCQWRGERARSTRPRRHHECGGHAEISRRRRDQREGQDALPQPDGI